MSENATTPDLRAELESLRRRAAEIEQRIDEVESQLLETAPANDWREGKPYPTYYATTGFFLGMAGAVASLLFNIVGSVAVGQHPLRLIQVYLTFGVGEKALTGNYNDSLALLIGCCLYIATGMVYGVPFQLAMSRFAPQADLIRRLIVATGLGLVLWIVNYYLILSWLQPMLFGGNWIVDLVPWYVGAATHLVYAWTMAVLYPYGVFAPYRLLNASPSTENA